jgi:enterochelin esterase-like enzyme
MLAPALALILAVAAQAVHSPRLQQLQRDVASDPAALPAFWDEIRLAGAPLIEPCDEPRSHLVTFLWRSEPESHVLLLADFTDSVPHMTLARLPGTDVWFRSYTFEDEERFLYQLSVDDAKWPLVRGDEVDFPSAPQGDPLNPQRYGDNAVRFSSIVAMPAAAPVLPTEPDAAIPHGVVSRLPELLRSKLLGNERAIFVYRPPGYDEHADPYALLIFGSSYIRQTRLPLILDGLIAGRRIPPVCVAFIDFTNVEQDEEEGGGPASADFVAAELLPWLRQRLHVTEDPARVIVGGASAGGHWAACVALQHPEAVGNVIAQSGAFWRGLGRDAAWWSDRAHAGEREGARSLCAARDSVPLRFRLIVGRIEEGTAFDPGRVSMLEASRRLREALVAKGADVTLVESAGGHDPFNWEATLPDALVSLLGAP